MLSLFLPLLALASPKTFPVAGATLELAKGESAESRADPVSSANDIVTTITLREAKPGEAQITFTHSGHCLKGRPHCADGTITESKDVTLRAGKPELVLVLWTDYSFTLKDSSDGKATIEVLKPTARITSKAKQKQGKVSIEGDAAGVVSVTVSVTSGARSTDLEKSVEASVVGGHWVAEFADLPSGRYRVMVSAGRTASLAQGRLAVH